MTTATTHSAREASDWLSPIIVKELRQGMRGRVFLGSFLLIQVAMMFCTSGALVAASVSSGGQLEFFSGLFWFIIAVPLLGILPFIGNGALGNEIKANSLELVYLTRLTPWRIVAGKWAALFAQGLLFVFSVLPYLVLRYFLGGVDLVTELAALAFLLVFSVCLTAVTVGFSAHNTWIVRGGLILFLFFGLGAAVEAYFIGAAGVFGFTGGGGIDQNPYVLLAVFVPLGLLLMFEIGTSKIAPPAESRSFHLRALGMLFLAVAALIDFAGDRSGLPLGLVAPALFVICLFSLCESPRWIRSIYVPYTRRGPLARACGRLFFYPGWPSAVIYTTLMSAVFSTLVYKHSGAFDGFPLSLLLVYSGLLFPVAVTRFMRPATPFGFAWFLSIHLGMLFLAILVTVLTQTGLIEAAVLVGFLPTSLALLLAWEVLPATDLTIYTAITAVVIGISVAVLLIRGVPLLSSFREMEQPVPAPPDSAQP